MILSDIDLKKLREQKCFPDNCYIGPSSVDLSLSPSYAKLTSVVDSSPSPTSIRSSFLFSSGIVPFLC